MQVGIITLGGRQIGVIMQGQESIDTTTPFIDDGGPSGNTMLGDDMPEAREERDPEGNASPGLRRRSHRGSTRSSGEPQEATPQSSDGMDPYGDGDEGKSRANKKPDITTPYGVGTGNPFNRERFAKELDEKPWLREKIKHISLGENQDPTANLAVVETMMNRAAVRGTSLEQQAKRHRSSGKDEGGYYAGYANDYNSAQGALADRSIDKALMGSNVTNYATDNSSGALAASEKVNGRFVHHKDFNRESFFSPGSAEPAFRNRWQQMRRAVDKYEHPDPSADGIAPPGTALPGKDKQSAAPAKTRVASAKENWHPDEAFNPHVEGRQFESNAEQITPPFPRSDTKPEPLQLDPKGKTPSGIYPPTPGDGGREDGTDQFSIPQDYDIG